jgi:hypothetical protein
LIDKIEQTHKLTDKQQEKEYWKEKNKICMQCINTCKQSSKVSIISCPRYSIQQQKGV